MYCINGDHGDVGHENDEEEQDGLDLLGLADFDSERGDGGELGCQGGGHQGGEEESKTEHSEQK